MHTMNECTHTCCTQNTQQVKKCLSIKGAEDIINRPHSFEISTNVENMFFIADTEKVQDRFQEVTHNSINAMLHTGKGGLDQRSGARHRQALALAHRQRRTRLHQPIAASHRDTHVSDCLPCMLPLLTRYRAM